MIFRVVNTSCTLSCTAVYTHNIAAARMCASCTPASAKPHANMQCSGLVATCVGATVVSCELPKIDYRDDLVLKDTNQQLDNVIVPQQTSLVSVKALQKLCQLVGVGPAASPHVKQVENQ